MTPPSMRTKTEGKNEFKIQRLFWGKKLQERKKKQVKRFPAKNNHSKWMTFKNFQIEILYVLECFSILPRFIGFTSVFHFKVQKKCLDLVCRWYKKRKFVWKMKTNILLLDSVVDAGNRFFEKKFL